MAKEQSLSEYVWAEKDGYQRRQFTRQQLEAMGTDFPATDSFDGWKIVDAIKEPEEVKSAKTAKPKVTNKTKSADDTTGKAVAETKGTGDTDSKDSGSLGDSAAQGSEGDTKAS